MAAPTVLPHSFVLADLFDVAAMSYPVPDHLLEDEPGLEWVTCHACDGEGWQGNDETIWKCPRCRGHREVLSDFPHTPLCTECHDTGYVPGRQPKSGRVYRYLLGIRACPCGRLWKAQATERKAA